jgi:hypothetical protein
VNKSMKWIRHCAYALVLVFTVATPSQSATVLNRFPIHLDGRVETAAPQAFDLDGDGQIELLIATSKHLYVLRADGSVLPGFPIDFQKGASIVAPFSLGILGKARTGVFFGTEDGQLHVLDSAGKPFPGYPLHIQSSLVAAPTVGDINGDGQPEMVFAAKDGKLWALDGSGRALPGYPAKLSTPVSTAVTIGRFRPGGPTLLIFGDERGQLHAWQAPNQEMPGFPTRAHYGVASQPVLGDIDDDGSFEVVFGSKDFKIYVIKADGSNASGFPVVTGYRLYTTCALADLNGDGVVEIVATSGDGKVYALGQKGKSLPGFPVPIGRRLRAAPIVGDIDHDGKPEIATGSDQNALVLLRSNGKPYPGFPYATEDAVEVAPLMADLNNDGHEELIGVSKNGALVAFHMLKIGNANQSLAWPAEGQNGLHRAATYPNPPRYRTLTISPEKARITDQLQLSYEFHDLDSDPEPHTIVHWYRNGTQVTEFDGARVVGKNTTKKHERWYFTLQAEPDGRVFKSPEVEIANTPPGAPEIVIQPDPARTDDALTMKIVREADDVDGDQIRYAIVWLKDRAAVKGLTQALVPANRTAKGERWTVVVTPNDGELDGAPHRASIVISNTSPTEPQVRLDPARPTVTQAVRVVVDRPGRDPDGDPVTYRYHWQANDRPLNAPQDQAVLKAGFVGKQGTIQVAVDSFDGVDVGGRASATAEIINSPPEAPVVQIVQGMRRAHDDVSITVQQAAADADMDRIEYLYQWQCKEKPYDQPAARQPLIPASDALKGEHWSVTVTPRDGETTGLPARAEITIRNSPPEPPLVKATNQRPFATDDLVCEVVQPASDPDADKVTVEVIWLEDGQREISRGRDLWRLPAGKTRKQKRYLAKMIPSDGVVTGRGAEQWFEVQNSPPRECQVTIKPAQPQTGEALAALITKPSVDADSDIVQMRYRWTVDGKPLQSGARPDQIDGREVKRGQRWMVQAVPFDGEAEGPACEASAIVKNSRPVGPQIAVDPMQPTATDTLRIKVVKPASDIDGDTLSLAVLWTVDGQSFPAGPGMEPVPAGSLKKGQHWVVTAIVSDGELQSNPVSQEVVVANAPPASPKLEIRPIKPLAGEPLSCHLIQPTMDPDRDSLTHVYTWFIGDEKGYTKDKPIGGEAVFPAGKTHKGEHWVCRAAASDGQLTGPESSVAVTIGNAGPTAPKVEIRPTYPQDQQELKCVIIAESVDSDGDKIRYRFSWSKNGMAQPFAPETDIVPGRKVKKGEIWQCTVIASDGRLDSPASSSIDVLVVPRS